MKKLCPILIKLSTLQDVDALLSDIKVAKSRAKKTGGEHSVWRKDELGRSIGWTIHLPLIECFKGKK